MNSKTRLIHKFGNTELFDEGEGTYLLVERIGGTVHRTRMSKKDASRWIRSNNYRTTTGSIEMKEDTTNVR